jgi:hypothetical protein
MLWVVEGGIVSRKSAFSVPERLKPGALVEHVYELSVMNHVWNKAQAAVSIKVRTAFFVQK